MSIVKRLGRIISLLVLAAALAACSAIKLGYNNLDDIAYWWLDGYVDFSDDQSTRVREDLGRIHRWHRTQELPLLAVLLQGVERLAPGDITAAQACAIVDQVNERIDALADRAEPAVVTLASALLPEQLVHLERKYQKGNADFRKEWVNTKPAEQAEKRFEQIVERSEMIYGKLDESQRVALRKQAAQSAFDPLRVLAERQRRQRDVLETLRKVAAPSVPLGEARGLMRGLFDRARKPAEPAARAYTQSIIDEGCRTVAMLHNSTSAAQRDVAVRRLRAYQRDLNELAARL